MIKFLQLSIVIVGAFAICATAQAQSYDQQTIPEAVDQGLYRPNSNRDEKLKDAMFGSNGETYQTQINAPADPVGIEGEVVGGRRSARLLPKLSNARRTRGIHPASKASAESISRYQLSAQA